MRTLILFLALIAAAISGLAQRHKLAAINAETPEGQLLQQIGQESDEAKKIGLLEQFAGKYPKHEGAAWVYAQMQPLYVKTGQFDKAIDIGEKLIALDPEDVEFAHQTLKAAEAKKDAGAIKTWALRTSEIARKVAASPQPKEEGEVEDWKTRVAFAKQVDTYAEYALYAAALQSTDLAKKADLAGALEQHNPKNQYLPQIREQIFLGYVQAKDMEKAVAMVERVPPEQQTSEVMLLAAADYYLYRKQPDKVLAFCSRVIELDKTRAKPEGMSDADFARQKAAALGRAHWMAGVTYMNEGKLGQADQSLRAALPLVRGDANLLSEALFHLGVANYRMGDAAKGDEGQSRIMDAFRFTKECAAMKGRFQAQAQKNLAAMQAKYRLK